MDLSGIYNDIRRRTKDFSRQFDGKRILIIGEDYKESENIKHLLKEFGFREVHTINPLHSLSIDFRLSNTDLILIDENNFNTDIQPGIEERVKNISHTPFIVIGNSFSTARNVLSRNCYGFILRPVSKMSLYPAVVSSIIIGEKVEALDRKLELYSKITDMIPEVILVKDQDFNYSYINQRFFGIIGENYAKSVLGKNDFDLFDSEISEKIRREDESLRNGELQELNKEFYIEELKKWFNIYKVPLRDNRGSFIGILVSVRDITDLKKKEIEGERIIIKEIRYRDSAIFRMIKKIDEKLSEEIRLRESLKEVKDERDVILNSIDSGLIYIGRDYSVKWINRAACSILGVENSVSGGVKCRNLMLCVDSECTDECPIHRALVRGKHGERIIRNKNVQYLNLKSTPVFGEDGRVRNVLAVIEDVTQKKMLESKNIQQEKMEALGRLTAGIVHDFNNVLTVIRGYSEIILEDMTEDNRFYRDIKEIFETSKKASNLVNQLKLFYRNDSSDREVLNINDIIVSHRSIFSNLMGDRIKVEYRLNKDLKDVKCSKAHLQQIIMNLVLNARDAIRDGGTIYITTDNVYIERGFSKSIIPVKQGIYILFEIADTGTGIEENEAKKIFEPFYTTKKEKGTGFGLSTVYALVKSYGGGIYLSSTKGYGTVFRIYLPVSDTDKKEKDACKKSDVSYHINGKIVLVESNHDIAEYILRVVEKHGGVIKLTDSVIRALDIVTKDSAVSVCIMDAVSSPGNSFITHKEIANFPERVGIILITDYGITDYKIKRDSRRVLILEKPVREYELIQKIKEALKR